MEMNKIEPIDNNKSMWDKIDEGYVKLDRDKAKIIIIMNWKVEDIEKFRDEKESQRLGKDVLKKQTEFSADVISEDGKPANKTFSTTSVNAMRSLRIVLYDKSPNTPVQLRIKKIGEGVKTVYDIEEQEIQK
jgi:hypothetical protein